MTAARFLEADGDYGVAAGDGTEVSTVLWLLRLRQRSSVRSMGASGRREDF